VESCQSHARQRDYETVSIQIGDDAIFALIQVKYGQKAQAKQFGRASALGLRSFGCSKARFSETPGVVSASIPKNAATEVNGKAAAHGDPAKGDGGQVSPRLTRRTP
jgi:hypothetical protein